MKTIEEIKEELEKALIEAREAWNSSEAYNILERAIEDVVKE